MSFSDELKMLSFRENPSIEKVRAILTSAARDGKSYAIVKEYEIAEDDVEIVLSYLKTQGFSVDYSKYIQEYKISWL
jgi:hypothetical protein